MLTIFTHAAVPQAVGLGLGKDVISRRVMVTGVVASMTPDLDGISFRAGTQGIHTFDIVRFVLWLAGCDISPVFQNQSIDGILFYWRCRTVTHFSGCHNQWRIGNGPAMALFK